MCRGSWVVGAWVSVCHGEEPGSSGHHDSNGRALRQDACNSMPLYPTNTMVPWSPAPRPPSVTEPNCLLVHVGLWLALSIPPTLTTHAPNNSSKTPLAHHAPNDEPDGGRPQGGLWGQRRGPLPRSEF